MLLDFVLVLSALCVGGIAGWFLRTYFGSPAAPTPAKESPPEFTAAREILGRLHHVAKNIAVDVNRHNDRVEEISLQLQAIDDEHGSVVAEAVQQLMDANAGMKQQLGIAERRLQQQAQIIETQTQEARTDALTNLANRRALEAELSSLIDQSRERDFSVWSILVDVDFFKRVNDTYGHQAGDEVLRGVARVLTEICPDNALPARFGGEEFAVIVADATEESARELSERIRVAIETSEFPYHDLQLSVTASLGLSQIGAQESGNDMIARADEALYVSKESGRNSAHFHTGEAIVPICIQAPAADEETVDQPEVEPPVASPAKPRAAWAKDLLSALTHRENFLEDVDRRIAENRRGGAPLAVMLIEIDGLEEFVEKQGTQVALQILRLVSRCVQGVMREMDLLGRYEHQQLALLLPGSKLDGAASVAGRLREKISRVPFDSVTDAAITISMGVSENCEGDSAERMLERSEKALEVAHERGGNGAYYHDGHRAIDIAERSMV